MRLFNPRRSHLNLPIIASHFSFDTSLVRPLIPNSATVTSTLAAAADDDIGDEHNNDNDSAAAAAAKVEEFVKEGGRGGGLSDAGAAAVENGFKPLNLRYAVLSNCRWWLEKVLCFKVPNVF